MGFAVDVFGYWFITSGRFLCSACWQSGGGYPKSMAGEGYAIPTYSISGSQHRVRGRCCLCNLKIDGEVMRLSLPKGFRNPSQPGLTPGVGA